jgi:16S rRNA processing protein RimM
LLDDLIGLTAVTTGGEAIGTVTAVEEAGPQFLLVLDTARGEILIPFHRSLCPSLDLDARRVVIDPPEGLLDPRRAIEAR